MWGHRKTLDRHMQIFSIFSRMIGNIPAPAILKALDAECRMLEDDFKHFRLNAINATEDALSILCFRGFVQMAKSESILRCSKQLPLEHVEFYRETTNRLIEVGELPSSAIDEFDYAFNLNEPTRRKSYG